MSKERTVGWREWIRFPDLTQTPIKAKLDTGAKSSALHAPTLSTFSDGQGEWAEFVLRPRQRSKIGEINVSLPIKNWITVKSSNGQIETRPVVEITCELGSEKLNIDVTLTRRYKMTYRCLLGRDALKNKFAVSPGKSFTAGKPG
jgi:hypothetical protein